MKRQEGRAAVWALIGLALIVVAVVVAAKVVAPPLIKERLEQELTKAWQAEVNVASVEVHLLPLGVTVHGIALTDLYNPKQNLAVIGSAYAEPALIDMIRMDMKPILDVVDIRGIRMYQKRAREGRVLKKVDRRLIEQTRALAKAGLPQVSLPDPQKILASEDLRTVAEAEKLRQQIEALQKQWETLRQGLPDEQRIEAYRKELAALKKRGLDPQALSQFNQLKGRIEADLAKIREAQKLLDQAQALKRSLASLRRLPGEDLRRLQKKYAFNAQGMTNLMQTLLGEQVRQYLQVATGWAARIKPLLADKPEQAGGGGPNPALDTLVRQLRINGELPTGRFNAQARNVTVNQALYQVTTPYKIQFQHLKADKPVEISGVADLLKPSQAQIKALLEGIGIHLKDLPLSDSSTLALVLKQAQTSLKGRADLISWEKIKGEVTADFAQVSLDLLKAAEPEVQKYLKPVLEQVKDFNVTVKFSGSLHAPKIDIRSDLDRVLGRSLQRVMQQELDRAKQQLLAELRQRAEREAGELSSLVGPLLEGKLKVDQLQGELEAMLRQKLESAAEDELKKRLPDALKQLPGGVKLPF